MKKFFQSKGFIVTSLAVLCVAILGVCWFASRDRTEDFKPEESPPSSTTAIGRMAAHRQTVRAAPEPMRPASPPVLKRSTPR